MDNTERNLMLEASRAHREENGMLRIENKLLREGIEEMYEWLVDDKELQSLIPQEMWDKWEALIDRNIPIQLRMF
jgi:hypothetical protein|tara:strand:+ start:1554 stop:1778 length:225 start_codon:yes stop_codon:yes gene_type:complete